MRQAYWSGSSNGFKEVARFCVLLFYCCPCLTLPLSAANLLNDSSFEGPGNNHWGYEGCKFAEVDFGSQAVHGSHSLRFPHVNRLSGIPLDTPTSGLQQARLYYHGVSATPGGQYTFSAWAKSDTDSSLLGTIKFAIYDSNRQTKSLLAASSVTPLTQSWQRYSFTATLPAAQNNKYVLMIEFFGDAPNANPYPNPPRAHGLIDAVQFETGPVATAYAPIQPIEYGLLPRRDANAWTWGDNVLVDFYASNTGEVSVNNTVEYSVEDYYGRVVRSGTLDLVLPPNLRVENTLDLGSDLRGHFRMLIKEDGLIRTEKVFSTLPPPKAVAPADSLYGIDATMSEFIMETLRRMGIKWLRPHADLSWESIEPAQGVFKFPDYRTQLAQSKGLQLYGFLYRTPTWAQPAGGNNKSMPNNLSAWSNFVYRTVAYYQGQISEFEIYNEPCFQLSSSEYLSLMQLAHGAAQLANPAAKVFGWSGVLDGPSGYCYADINAQLVPMMGLVSAHYYPSYAGTAGTSFYQTLLQHRTIAGQGTLPLWNTESGAVGGGTFYKTKSDFEANDVRNFHAADLAKTWTFHKAANVRMFYYWMNFPNADQTPGWSSSFSFNEYDSSLKASAVATAASAYFLDGADVAFDQILYTGSAAHQQVTAYAFNRGAADHVVVAWVDRTDRAVIVGHPALPATTQVYDMFGRLVRAFAPGEPLQIELRSSPVYIEIVGYAGAVNSGFLQLGASIPDPSALIQAPLTPIGGSTLIELYGSSQPTPGSEDLIFRTSLSAAGTVTHAWSAPVLTPDADTLLLLHLDQRSEFAETATSVHDFGPLNKIGTLTSDDGTLALGDAYGRLAGGIHSSGGQVARALQIPNNGDFNGLNPFTLALWAKLDGSSSANRLLSLGNVSGFNLGGSSTALGVKIRETGSELIFQVSDGTLAGQRWSSSKFPKGDGLYHHVAFVFDGRAVDPADRRLDIYLDGVKVNGSLNGGSIASQTKSVNSEDLYFLGWAPGGSSQSATGNIDEVYFQRRALSEGEIQGLSMLQSGQTYYWFTKSIGTTTTSSPISSEVARIFDGLTYTVTARGQGAVANVSPAGAPLYYGQTAEATATPHSGESFQNWIGTVFSTDNPLTLTVHQDIQLTALAAGPAGVNSAPSLNPIGNQSINEGTTLAFQATGSDSETFASSLIFSLDPGAPAGAYLSPLGLFTWTTHEGHGPGSYSVTLKVTDTGVPALSAEETILITVLEVNSPPVLAPIANRNVNEGSLVAFNATASNPDLPAQTLTFTLEPGFPSGATLTTGGLFSWLPNESQGPGVYPITLKVTDNGSPAQSDSRTFTVTVAEVNTPPTLPPITDQSVVEGSLLQFGVTGSDLDQPSQLLTYALDPGTPSGAVVTAEGLFSWTPSEAQGPGNYTITLRVTDNGTPPYSASQTFSVDVSEANLPPTLIPIGNQGVGEGQTLSFTASGSDSDLPAQNYVLSLDPGAPDGASITPAGAFLWTPTELQGPGEYVLTVRVTDNGTPPLSVFETLTVSVSEINLPPILNAIGNRSVDEGNLVQFTAVASDPDLPVQSIAFSLAPGAPSAAAITPTGEFSWTPGESDGPGNYPVTVRVTDTGSPPMTTFETITITVNELNSAPVLNSIGNLEGAEGQLLGFTATASDTDLPAQALTFSLGLGSPLGASISPEGAFTWIPSEAQGPGSYSITVILTDNGSPPMISSETLTLTVSENESVPVLSPVGNRTVDEGTALSINVSATDSDIPVQTLTYTLGPGGPAGASLTPTGSFSWTPSEDQGPGTYPITITVTDSASPPLSSSDTFTVTVAEVNTAPTLGSIGNQSVPENTLLTFTATAGDTDLPIQSLTYTLGPGAPSGASITSAGVFTWTPTEAQGPGSYPLTVIVMENASSSLTAFETLTLNVGEVDSSPVLDPINNQSVNELSLLSFSVTAIDADLPAQLLTYSLAPGAPAGATLTSGGAFSWTPTEAQGPGSYPITVIVSDNGSPSLTATTTFTITVDDVNNTPTLTPIGNQTIAENSLLSFTAVAADSDLPVQTLTYSLNPGAPSGASITAAGAFTWTPTEAQGPGTYPITVVATDNGSPVHSATETLSVTVTEVNTAPTLTPIGNQNVSEGTLLTFTATASDADLPTPTFTYTLGAGAPSGASITSAGLFTWTPTAAQGPSSYPVTVIVSDGGSPPLTASETFSITVIDLGTDPVLTPIGNKTVNEGSLLSFTALATDSDLPVQTLTYSLNPGAPSGASITAAGGFTWTPTEAQGPGTYPITIVVTDNGSPALSATETLTVTVTEVNAAPTLTSIGNQSVSEATLLTFTATASDADLPTPTFTFALGAGAPVGASITSAGLFTWTPTAAQGPNSYPVTVIVSDGGSPALAASETITITVTDTGSNPVLTPIGNKTVNESSLLSFTALATDSDLPVQTLTYSLNPGAPSGASITAAGAFTWTPTEAQGPGTYPITIVVTDNGSPALSATETLTVTVTEVNAAPTLTSIGNQSVSEATLLTFTATASDADLPTPTFTFALGAGAPVGASITSAGLFTWTPTTAQGPNSYPVTVIVSDGGSPPLTASETITVTVTDTGSNPVLTPIGNKTVNEGSLLSFTALATDSDLPVQTLTYSLNPGAPSGASITAAGAFTWTPTEAQGPGTYPITIVVTDNGSPTLSATETLTVTVNEVNAAPTLTSIGNQSVSEGTLLTFTATASDADLPTPTFTFALGAGAPVGASITSAGLFTWTPTTAQGPNSYPVTVIVSDGGSPPLTASETITVTVTDTGSNPVLTPIGNKTVNEGSLLSFTALATDSDLPVQTLTYSLNPGAPSGASITAAGAFTWTPTEAQGPGTYPITVKVTDNGSPALSATETLTVTVNEVNAAPTLATIPNSSIAQGALLSLTATGTDTDVPVQTLSYALEPGAPLGATITSGGLFTWTPSGAQGAGSYPISIRASDNGSPALSDVKTFQVTVTAPTSTTTFNAPASISIPSSGVSPPYPSTLTVSGLATSLSKVVVKLTAMNHTWPDDVDVLLTGPTGVKVLLMSDAGGSADFVNTSLTFDDAATGSLADNALIATGIYKPTNFGTGDTFPAPAPATPYLTALSAFNATNPNGTWSLFVVDDEANDLGNISGGWSLTLTTGTPPPVNTPPTITNLPDISTQRNVATPVISFTVGDAQTAAVSLIVTAASSNTSLVPNANVVLGGIGASRTVQITPAAGLVGSTTLTLTVTDQQGATGVDTFVLTVVDPTLPPSLSNPAPITIPSVGVSSPYPSSITVSGLSGVITKVTVTLNKWNHVFPDDVDMLLVGPAGQKVILVSDVGGSGDAINTILTLDDSAASSLPDSTQVNSGTFKPTNIGTGDTFAAPAPAGPYGSALADFNGTNPNGVWSLHIVDDDAGDSGILSEGWSMAITIGTPTPTFTSTTSITIPALGVAAPYPSTLAVSGLPGLLTGVTVKLNGVSHLFPDDIDVLLVGPTGKKVVLMSDVGGSPDLVNVDLTFDTAAASSLPDATQILAGVYKPTNIGAGDTFAAPAPAGPYGSALTDFNGTNPNGTWSLYVLDDDTGDVGSISRGWTLNITSAVPPPSPQMPHPISLPRLHSIQFMSTGQVQLLVSASPGVTLLIEQSLDLDQWTPLGQVTADSALTEFVDNSEKRGRAQFYRARTLP